MHKMWINLFEVDHAKGGVIPTPEPESEPDFQPSSNPDSNSNSFPLEPLEPVPGVELSYEMVSAKTGMLIKSNFDMDICQIYK